MTDCLPSIRSLQIVKALYIEPHIDSRKSSSMLQKLTEDCGIRTIFTVFPDQVSALESIDHHHFDITFIGGCSVRSEDVEVFVKALRLRNLTTPVIFMADDHISISDKNCDELGLGGVLRYPYTGVTISGVLKNVIFHSSNEFNPQEIYFESVIPVKLPAAESSDIMANSSDSCQSTDGDDCEDNSENISQEDWIDLADNILDLFKDDTDDEKSICDSDEHEKMSEWSQRLLEGTETISADDTSLEPNNHKKRRVSEDDMMVDFDIFHPFLYDWEKERELTSM
eukprot:CAMPEP_0182416894 /NCGR_PEP_ID=MMETSP1167-20130531/1281_1 /TAXON_ID=2988 /ORGANISM="Mallomonas Sp, Strain CCMP3275" /LENGTH=282 /DNA_ID=CAMNT_0024590047 /DNA_START=70 /DNA_END=918 /DNA_ORIENTATION=-